METETLKVNATDKYPDAYSRHYRIRNLTLAFRRYQEIIKSYPNNREADSAVTQLRNIIQSVVPKLERLVVQIKLAAGICKDIDVDST